MAVALAALLLSVSVAQTANAQRGGMPTAASIPDSAFDRRSTAELRRIVELAQASALPTAPLVSRALQGAARRVPGARVVALVRAHADSMRAARFALGDLATSDELDAGATALRAGASRGSLRRVRAARSPGEATTALVVLTDLLSRGIDAGEASDALASLAVRAPDSTLLSLQSAVAREGLADSPARLREIVERISRQLPPGAPGRVPIPPRRPPDGDEERSAPDDPPPPDEAGRPATMEQSDGWRSLALASLAGGSDTDPRGVLAEGRLPFALTRAWGVVPVGTLRFTDEGSRWEASLAFTRRLRLAAPLDARLFLRGEMRSPIATSRGDLPIDPRLDAQRLPVGRSPELSFRLGSEVRRRLGSSLVVGSLALGQDRYSRLATTLVEVTGAPPVDTMTPRPDTLRPVVREELRTFWRSLGTTSLRGTLALRRRGWVLEGGYTQRLSAGQLTNDSLTRVPVSLFTLGAERRVAPWATLVAQWASRDPSRVLGAPALAEARLRVGIRLIDEPRARVRPRPARAPAHDERGAAITSVAVVPVTRAESANVVRVRVVAPLATSVEVEGDFTAWVPRALLRGSDGTFSGEFVAAGGLVRLRVRADGGAWSVPPGAPAQRDDFGDEVAVFVVDGDAQ